MAFAIFKMVFASGSASTPMRVKARYTRLAADLLLQLIEAPVV
jgi:hypothetical protein